METKADWPEWGRLIDDARDQLVPDLSQNAAAERAGMSGTRWRQIVSGAAGPMASPRGVKAVARMAQVVGLTSKDLEHIRGDVAAIMRKEESEQPAQDASGEDLVKLGRELIEQGKRLEEQGMRMLGQQPEQTDEPDRSAS